MNFHISDTFVDSLARLTSQEQKAVKTTVFDLQLNPAHPGLSFHKLDRAQDSNFASVRVNRDIRVIVHRTEGSMLVCFTGHHDEAYQWAQRRKLETHPRTGAAQLVEVREMVREVVVPVYVAVEQPKPRLFEKISDEALLSYGVPIDWLPDVRLADEDSILDLADHLPQEAVEALLELAVGGQPKPAPILETNGNPLEHPDAMRRFRVMEGIEELEQALEYPWEKWTVFLHPEQRKTVESQFDGPARVSGSAGTGKTVVALHRAVHLAKTHPGSRVLLATFSDTLAAALKMKLGRLLHNQPRLGEQIEVYSMNQMGERLYRMNFNASQIATPEDIRVIINEAAAQASGHGFRENFLFTEWEQVVDAWQLDSWEEYRDVLRLGRKTRLPVNRREILWRIFEDVRVKHREKGMITSSGMFGELSSHFAERKSPFEFMVIDESQDIKVSQLRFLATLSKGKPNSLFFAGDLGQRIFQQPFSWLALGVDIRGRSKTLRINYRTSHQIRSQADKLLAPELSDVDGVVEDRRGTISIFNGPPPDIGIFEGDDEEIEAVRKWLSGLLNDGFAPEEIGVFVRSEEELPRAIAAIKALGEKYKVLDEKVSTTSGYISISTMHLAKGLEFRAVVVMACDEEIIPSQQRIEEISDEADLEDVYNTERQLLYVACTRARDQLLVTSTKPASEFLDDLRV